MTTQSTALAKISASLGVSQEEIATTIKNMVVDAKGQRGGTCTPAEFMIFTTTCAKYDLNPLIKEVHAFLAGGKLVFCIGVDGWFKIMSRHPKFNGLETEDILNSDGSLRAVKAKLYLKGVDHPVCATEYLNECQHGRASNSSWFTHPHRRLENKAISQVVRRAMGVSEIVDEDEKQSIIAATKDITPTHAPIQSQPVITIDTIKRDLMAATSLPQIKSIARSLRDKLEAIGTWQALEGEFYSIYKAIADKLPKETPVIEDAEITPVETVNTVTGEVIHGATIVDHEDPNDNEVDFG